MDAGVVGRLTGRERIVLQPEALVFSHQRLLPEATAVWAAGGADRVNISKLCPNNLPCSP